MAIDVLSIIGIFLAVIPCVSYYRIIRSQFNYIKKEPVATRMAILSLRAASIIPGFSICYLISLADPTIYCAMQLPEAYMQGYSVFCFFCLITYYVGGPNTCTEVFKSTTHTFPVCIFGYMTKFPEKYYYHSYMAVWQFMFIRPIVVLLTIIAYYINQNNLSLIISALATLMAAFGVGGLVKFYHVLYDFCKGLNMTKKIFIIKTVIGLVLFQGFLEDVLFSFGFLNFSGGLKSFSAADKAIRLYCFAILFELVLFCVLVERAFSYDFKYTKGKNFNTGASKPNTDLSAIEDNLSVRDSNSSLSDSIIRQSDSTTSSSFAYPSFSDSSSIPSPTVPTRHPDAFISNENLTMWAFFMQVCNVMDVFDSVKMTYSQTTPAGIAGAATTAASISSNSAISISSKPRLSAMVEDDNPSLASRRDTHVALVDLKPSIITK